MTIDEARVEIAKVLHAHLDPSRRLFKDVLDGLSVDVLAYNSRVYYIITDRLGFGVIVDRLPITGSETVLDALTCPMRWLSCPIGAVASAAAAD